MRVFISYPREFQVFAVALEAELASRDIHRFLDRWNIVIGDVWRLKIESNIAKADLFVVLYLPEADTSDRVFCSEIALIRETCAETSGRRLITVIFPPTTIEQVPPHFRIRQLLLTDVAGDVKDKRHEYWIDQIVQQIERTRRAERLKWWRITATTISSIGAICIVALAIDLYRSKKEIIEKDEKIEVLNQQINQLTETGDGSVVCRRLIGDYSLHHRYVFVVGPDARSVATKGTWKTSGCKYNKGDEAYILDGDEETDFDVEMYIKGKYERIARARYHYSSKVRIAKDGKLLGRSFTAVLHPQNTPQWFDKDKNGNSLNLTREQLMSKFKEITDLRNDRHEELKVAPCLPAVGKHNGSTLVAFVCQDYTRVMVKTY